MVGVSIGVSGIMVDGVGIDGACVGITVVLLVVGVGVGSSVVVGVAPLMLGTEVGIVYISGGADDASGK
jgi:hypothetical protein